MLSTPATPAHLESKKDFPDSSLLSDLTHPSAISEPSLNNEENDWQKNYFEHAVQAIKQFDLSRLEFLMGPPQYYAWLEYTRDRHEVRVPRLSMFYAYTIKFINLYVDKLKYEAKYAAYSERVRTESAQRNFKQVEGDDESDSEHEEVNLANSESKTDIEDPVCTVYQTALTRYNSKGITEYFLTIASIKSKLDPMDGRAEMVLTKDQEHDFESQLKTYIQWRMAETLGQVKADLKEEIGVLSSMKSRALNENGYKEKYADPFIEQFNKRNKLMLERFKTIYKEYKEDVTLSNNLIALKARLKKEQLDLLKTLDKEEKLFNRNFDDDGKMHLKPLQKYQATVEDYYLRQAKLFPREKVSKLCSQDQKVQPVLVQETFANKMIDLRSKMSLDVFDRMKDKNGHVLMYHAMAFYRSCTDANREKLIPLIDLLFKHGCSPYPHAANQLTQRKKRRYQDAFEYANSLKPKDEKGESRNLPDWPILKGMLQYHLLTLNPTQENLRWRLVHYSSEKELVYKSSNSGWRGIWNTILRALYYENDIVESRKRHIAQLAHTLYLVQLYSADEAIKDTVGSIAGEIRNKSKLTGVTGNSDLLNTLNQFLSALGDIGNGQLIAFSGTLASSTQYLKGSYSPVSYNGATIQEVMAQLNKEKEARKSDIEKMKLLQDEREKQFRVELDGIEKRRIESEQKLRAEMEQKLEVEKMQYNKKIEEVAESASNNLMQKLQSGQLLNVTNDAARHTASTITNAVQSPKAADDRVGQENDDSPFDPSEPLPMPPPKPNIQLLKSIFPNISTDLQNRPAVSQYAALEHKAKI